MLLTEEQASIRDTLRAFASERYRDVRVCQIYEGTSEIQRLVIGRALVS